MGRADSSFLIPIMTLMNPGSTEVHGERVKDNSHKVKGRRFSFKMKNIPFKDDKVLKQGGKMVMERPSWEVFKS